MKKILTGIISLALLVGAIVAYGKFYDRKVPNFRGSAELFIYPGMTASEVQDSILARCKVKKPRSLARAMREEGAPVPGHYVVDSTCSSTYVARMIHHGWQTPVTLTLSGSIRSYRMMARKIGSQMLADSASIALFCRDSLRSRKLDTAMLFTRIIPDSYRILWTATPGEIVDRLISEADSWWIPERLAAARKQGLTRNEAVTLASIVDGETRYVPEQPTIAGVYLNRLRTGMKLQADPTVAYCYGYKLNRILKSHLEVNSPYNTYRNYGLPPGPISCPPKSCLEAVLHPASHNYVFFCADPSFNGSHRFAATYAEHMVNARAFQKALNERNAKK